MQVNDVFSAMPEPKLLNKQSSESPSSPSPSKELMNSFGSELENRINQIKSLQDNAQTKMRQFAAGKLDSVHDVSIAVQKANMGFRLAGLVREKVLSGFETLQQMQ